MLRFLAFALLWMVGLQILIATTLWGSGLLESHLRLQATLARALLSPVYSELRVTGTVVSSPRFAMEVKHGCDALQPIAIFLAVVVAFPARWSEKIIGAVVGVVLLLVLNVVRLSTLYVVGHHFEEYFELMHMTVWQGLFVLSAFGLWMAWVAWLGRRARPG